MDLTSLYKNHEHRPDLLGEHKYGDAFQFILFIVFMLVWVTDCFIFHYSDFLTKYVPSYVRLPLGIIVLLASSYFAWSGLRIVFGKVREKPEIIKEGVFGLVRHPVYLGALLFYLGLFIITPSIAAFGVGLLGFALYHYLARYEEKLLLAKFGDAYRDYMAKVPMWLPGIARKPK